MLQLFKQHNYVFCSLYGIIAIAGKDLTFLANPQSKAVFTEKVKKII